MSFLLFSVKYGMHFANTQTRLGNSEVECKFHRGAHYKLRRGIRMCVCAWRGANSPEWLQLSLFETLFARSTAYLYLIWPRCTTHTQMRAHISLIFSRSPATIPLVITALYVGRKLRREMVWNESGALAFSPSSLSLPANVAADPFEVTLCLYRKHKLAQMEVIIQLKPGQGVHRKCSEKVNTHSAVTRESFTQGMHNSFFSLIKNL